MSVACPANILAAGRVLHGEHGFVDLLTSLSADNLGTQDLVSLRLRYELDDTIDVIVSLGPGVGHEREGSGLDGVASLSSLIRVHSYPSDLGVSVDNARNSGIVNMTMTTSNVFYASNTLLFCLMGKHGAGNAIANGVHIRYRCAEFLVYNDPVPVVCLHANTLQVEVVSERAAADGHKYGVGVQRLGFTASYGLHLERYRVAVVGATNHLCTEHEVHALLLE
mmetsp:Transcript_18839/g.47868  ORF Transcript_18839/g.47868 Transcript_18839/m.47868 type:complete len:223 (-) Transcript_18839:861-1529(-)